MNLAKLVTIFAVISITACSTANRFKTYYGDYGNTEAIQVDKSANPKLIETFDLPGKVALYESKNFVVLGVSSFDGEWEARTKAIDLARKIGATVVITQSNYTGSIARQYSISVPTSNTSYHSGTVYSNYGSSATYSGTTTSYGSQQINRSYVIGQYEQEAVFMAKRVVEKND